MLSVDNLLDIPPPQDCSPSQIGSGGRVSPSFKKIPRLVRPGRLGSRVQGSASFHKIPRLVGRIGSRVRVSGSFQIFSSANLCGKYFDGGAVISWIQSHQICETKTDCYKSTTIFSSVSDAGTVLCGWVTGA